MKIRTLKVILTWIAAVASLASAVVFAAQHYLGPEVQRLFISEINKSLTAEVQVGSVDLSLVKDFPFASVRFTGIRMKEAIKSPAKKDLLTASAISLRFNIWDLLRKKYRVTNIRLDDVQAFPRVFADGTDNFHCWKQAGGGSEAFNFELQRILIHNLRIVYINEATQLKADIVLPDMVAKGHFGEAQHSMALSGNMQVAELTARGVKYIAGRDLAMSLRMEVDNATGTYRITDGRVKTGKLMLEAGGGFVINKATKECDLSVSATGSTLEEMISMVPARYLEKLKGYSFKGPASLSAKIKGPFGGSHMPAIAVTLGMQGCEITEQQSGISLRDLSATALYQAGSGGSGENLSVNGLKATFGDGFIRGSLAMQGFTSPHIAANAALSLNLSELHRFLHSDTIRSVSGRLAANFSFDGTIRDINKPRADDFLKSQFNGNGTLQQATFELKGYRLPAKGIQSQFTFNGNELQISQLSATLGGSDFLLRGTLSNFPAWLFVKGEQLSVAGALQSQRLDWDELSEIEESSAGEYHFSLPDDITITGLQAKVKQFSFRKFRATDLSFRAQMRNKVLSVSDVSMATSQGRVTGQANINAQAENHALLQSKARLEKVNIRNLFTEFGNFGQNDLVAENLEGLVTADVVYASVMLSNLEMDLNSVKTHADIMIENGRLVNYSPMQSLSAFLRVEDLADIRFETLQNQIDIANQVIYIPSMHIKSSALDLDLMGTHTFDNEIDYHLTIALADLLSAKFKKRNINFNNQEEFGPVEDDHRGRTKIFVSVSGTVDKPVVKYDRKAIREKISTELKSQKAELKQLFRQEFGQQADTLKKASRQKEKDVIKKQEEGKFVIEWDEDRK